MKYAIAEIYYNGKQHVAKISNDNVRPIFNTEKVKEVKNGCVVKYSLEDQFCHIVPIEQIEQTMNELRLR